MKRRVDIALMMGGNSSEREISIQSAIEVAKSLDKERYNIYMIDVKGRNWGYKDENDREWQVDKNDFSLTVEGRKIPLDYALIMIHGTPGEDGKMQGYLEMMGISYSTCNMVSTVLTFDKLACKRIVAQHGVVLAKEIMIREGEAVDTKEMVRRLGLPMFIKPNASGSSFGVTKVTEEEQIERAVEQARSEGGDVLAEEFVDGREVGCGVMITKKREYLLPITEIIPKSEFFDYQAKYTPGGADEITPAQMSEEVTDSVKEMARRAYLACDCRGIVRIDFIVRPSGEAVMIEINSIPGMSGGSIVPKQLVAAEIEPRVFFNELIEDTYSRRE